MDLVVCLRCLATCPDIQLVSVMPNGHIAEVKYLVSYGASLFFYIHLFTARTKP